MHDLPESTDQVALRRWIEAGLSIPEIRGLYGDAGYLLSNMLAKYTLAASTYDISKGALAEFKQRRVDLTATYRRGKFYGKESPFLYEHPVPTGVVRDHLLTMPNQVSDLRPVLVHMGRVAVVLRSEDERLRKASLASRMPSGWCFGDSPLARYERVGIEISDQHLKVAGAIRR